MARQENGLNEGMKQPARGLPLWKRTLDLGLILAVSPGLALLGTAMALVIKLGSPGPILFRQRRVGFKGQEFTCYKFRTMQINAETESHRLHTQNLIKSHDPMTKLDTRRDPRLIPLGPLIRSCGLDELPQLINVFRGEMSLVGPRPPLPYEFDQYEQWQFHRLQARPGMTGLWQVSGRNRLSYRQMCELDLEYVRRWSLWLDLRILLKTIPVVLFNSSNAY